MSVRFALPVPFGGSGEIAYEVVEIGGGVGAGKGALFLQVLRAAAAVNGHRTPAVHGQARARDEAGVAVVDGEVAAKWWTV